MGVNVFLETLVGCVNLPAAYNACLACAIDGSLTTDVQFITLFKTFAKMTSLLSSEEVGQSMAATNFQIVQLVIEKWNSEKIDVRKAAVDTLTQISSKIGER